MVEGKIKMIKKIKDLNKEKKLISFSIVWILFAFALFAVYYESEVNKINATMMAFSYKYGFISRGLIGSFYQILNAISPFDIMNYAGIMLYTQGITILYFIILFVFFMYSLKKCKLTISQEIKYIIIYFTIWAIPMFITEYNFGRLDVYCVMLSLLGAIVLISGKAEWLVVIISALGVMVHQGNVFMFLNIILVLLLYKAMSHEGKNRKKYVILCVLSFLVASSLFLYFELFSHVNGQDIYDEVVSIASSLRFDGTYHKDVIDHEILGIDLSDRETKFRLSNVIQFPIFIIFMLPYVVLGFKLFKNIIKNATNKMEKWKYFFVAIGAGTILPDLILKCDYGRWMFTIICYYSVVIISLLAMKDEHVTNEVKNLMNNVETKFPGAVILLVYPIMLQPLLDVGITYKTSELADIINTTFLHWW